MKTQDIEGDKQSYLKLKFCRIVSHADPNVSKENRLQLALGPGDYAETQQQR